MTNALLSALVDDAALFPPGNAPMAKAVADHRAHRVGPHAGLLGRFLCRGTRIPELADSLAPDDVFRLGLIADTGANGLPAALAAVAADPRLVLEAIEIPVPADGDQRAAARTVLDALPDGPLCYLELARTPAWRDALDLVASAGRGAKLRTGGLTASAFPSEQEVADFIHACVERGLAFKMTAGLHNAVRHQDPATSFEHHGFLNILLATVAAADGADAAALVALLAERSPDALARQARAVPAELASRARGHFVGYGSCSFGEPVEDLAKLGLLAAA